MAIDSGSQARELLLELTLRDAVALLGKRFSKGYLPYDKIVETAWALGALSPFVQTQEDDGGFQ